MNRYLKLSSPYDNCKAGVGGTRREKKRKLKKYGETCPNCNIIMIMPSSPNNGSLLPNHATIEHVYNKWDIRRAIEPYGKKKIVVCYSCNQKSQHEFEKKMGLHGKKKNDFSIIQLLKDTLYQEWIEEYNQFLILKKEKK